MSAAKTGREIGMTFRGCEVRAILEGRKTQTRRIVKPQPPSYIDELHGNQLRKRAPYTLEHYESGLIVGSGFQDDNDRYYRSPCNTGDLLWVREAWCQKAYDGYAIYNADGNLDSSCCHYRADGIHVVKVDGDGGTWFTKAGREASPWHPSIHMPRWAARLFLRVTTVRVERLQEIDEQDAKAEGTEPGCLTCGENCIYTGGCGYCRPCYRDSFAWLWKSINGPDSWSANPWVWVIEFEKVKS